MAKKRSFELDEFGFSKDLDFDMPDFQFGSDVKDDRKPVTVMKDSILAGAKSRVKEADFYRRMVKAALPSGYGSAMDVADEIGGTLRNLYDEAGKELKPALRDLKRVTERISPQLEGVLPRAMMDKVKKWSSKKEDVNYSAMADNAREAGISGELGEIFKTNIEADNKRSANTEAKDLMRDVMNNRRHGDSMGQLNSIRVAMQQMASYQARVVTAYQRKSLELQFRHYFVAVDSLEQQKRINVVLEERMKEISKNTGLPDYVKLHGSERIKEMFRDSLLEGVGGGLMGNRRDFAHRFTERFVKNAKGQIGEVLGAFRDGLAGVEGIMDAQQMRKELGDNNSMIGEIAGSSAMDSLAGRFGKWSRGKLKSNKTVAKYSNIAEYGTENRAQLLDEWARSSKGEGGPLDWLVRLVKDPMSGILNTKTGLVTDDVSGMHKPDLFSRMTNKSITEIIPGLLARIHRELIVTRTGDETAKPISYDFTTNKFSDGSSSAKNILGSIVKDTEKRYTTEDVDRFVSELDKDGELTPKQRKALGRQLLSDNMSNKVGRVSDYFNPTRFDGSAAEHAFEFSELFKKHYGQDEDHSKRTEFARNYNRLGQYVSNMHNTIQQHVNTGKSEELQQMGIIKDDGKSVNMDKLRSLYYDENVPEPDPKAVEPASLDEQLKPKRKRKSKKTDPNNPAIPGFAKGGTHKGGIRKVGEKGTELEVTGPSRIFNHDDTVKMLKEAGMATNEAIILAIQQASAKHETEAVFDTLLRIEAKLYEGINVTGNGTAFGRGKGPWANTTLRGSLKKAFGRGLDTTNFLRDQIKKRYTQARATAGKLSEGFLGMAGSAMYQGLQLGGKVFKWGKDKYDATKDLFVEGELYARLEKSKLEAGEYFDQKTKKVLKSWKDIKGTVVDRYGKVVINTKDLKKTYMKDGVRATLMKRFQSLKDGVTDFLTQKIPPLAQMAFGAVKKVYNFFAHAPQDIYVKGKMDRGPFLFASGMENGIYFSATTGKVIKRPADIDGPVMNQRKNIILKAKDIVAGLVDVNGKPIRFGVRGLMDKFKDTLSAGGELVSKRIGQIKDLVGGAWRKVKGAFTGVPGKAKEAMAGTAQGMMLVRLTEIRNILDSRLPAKKRKVAGDLTGDGVREGSTEDLMAKAREKASGIGGKIKGFFGKTYDGVEGKLTALIELTKKSLKVQEKTADNTEKSLLDRATDFLGMGGGKGKMAGKLAKGAMKWGGKALGVAGAAYGAYSAYENVKEGNYGEAALDAGLATASGVAGIGGLSALTGGAAAAGTGLMGVLGTGAAAVGTGLAALLASPVALGALAVAAVGVGAYFGYKWLSKKMTKPGPLLRFRLAQYGFDANNTDKAEKLRALEEELWSAIQYQGSTAQLDGKKVDVKKIFKIFDLTPPGKDGDLGKMDSKDAKAAKAFFQWFTVRFKPIFLQHATVLNTLAPNTTLADLDGEMKDETKAAYLDTVKADNPAYRFMGSPFKDDVAADFGPAGVQKVLDSVQAEIDKLKGEKKAPADGDKPLVDATPAAVTSLVSKDGEKKPVEKQQGFFGDLMQGVKDGAKPLTDMVSKVGGSMLGMALAFSPITIGISLTTKFLTTPMISTKLSALTAVRLKAYGLRDFNDSSQVQALLGLERYLLSNAAVSLKRTATGVTWSGAVEEVLANCASAFGLKPSNAAQGRGWVMWFHKRFMPVFLSYLTVVANLRGGDFAQADSAADQLPPAEQLDVIDVLVSSKAWYVSDSPWVGYVMNTDPGSVEMHQMFLRKQVNNKPLSAEQSAKTALDKPKAGSLGDGKSVAGQAAADPEKARQSGFWSDMSSKVSDVWKGAKNAIGEAGLAVGNAASTAWSATKSAASNFGQGVADAFGGGNQVVHPGGGTGGDINAIPQPKGKGTWASVKDTILAAAKMVGVDSKLMATMAAIESGFDWSVKAGTSSATGLYQFISGTWKTMLKKYGAKYGIAPNTPPTDPRANALMGAEFLRENTEAIKGAVGNRAITDTDLYLAHFLGAGGAKKLLSASPDSDAAQLMPDAARANKSIFYDPSGRPRTVGEVYSEINRRVRKKSVNTGEESTATAPAAGTTPSSTVSTTTAPARIPVADQTVGPAIKTSTAASTAASSAASSSAPAGAGPSGAGVVDAEMQANIGFSPRARDLSAQQQYQKEVAPAAMGSLDKSLQEVVGVNRDQLAVLTTIRDLMQNGNLKVTVTNPSAPQPASAPVAPAAPLQVARPMPEPPLSMRKKVRA